MAAPLWGSCGRVGGRADSVLQQQSHCEKNIMSSVNKMVTNGPLPIYPITILTHPINQSQPSLLISSLSSHISVVSPSFVLYLSPSFCDVMLCYIM